MFSKTMTNRMKAAAIAALMCVSVAATSVSVMTNSLPVDAVSIGETLKVKGVYRGTTVDIGTNLDAITFTLVADYTGNFSYGFGIGITKDPYWKEWDGSKGKWVAEAPGTDVAVVEGEEFTVTIDTSSLDLKYDPASSQYPGEYEFRNYYSGTGGKVEIISAVSGKGSGSTKPTDPDDDPGSSGGSGSAITDGSTSKNKKSGDWSFKDNKDGTGTMTATQARQLGDLGYVLTAGYDEDYYAAEGEAPGEDDPINSHKFSYSDFGVSGSIGPKTMDDVADEDRDNITIESLEATITSDVPIKRFMYGGGLNVLNESPADVESAKRIAGMEGKDNAGYWYNDMGEEKLEEAIDAGAEFEIEVGQGYDVEASTKNPLGEYFNVIWDVPQQVQPYVNSGQISFQFWYGEEDAEEYTALEEVTMEEAVLTYTEKKTFDYTDTASADVDATLEAGGDMAGVAYADLGLDANSKVGAVVFTLDVGSDLDKLVYGIGTSVGDDFQMWADGEGGDKWNCVLTDVKAGTVEICWIVPNGVDINEQYGNIQLGYWYGGKDGDELDEITLESVDVYYAQEEAPTEPPTTEPPTTEPPTTEPPTEPALEADYGDVDCNGKVDILDIIVLNRNLLGTGELTKQGQLNADVDLDKKPSAKDSLSILKYIVKLIDKLPV
ncbi:MAG: hypothetical protein E7504_00415 [Ruminococcus sp.]|nr:hypothetical protein [Ruminococcus sp.]